MSHKINEFPVRVCLHCNQHLCIIIPYIDLRPPSKYNPCDILPIILFIGFVNYNNYRQTSVALQVRYNIIIHYVHVIYRLGRECRWYPH